MWQGKTYTVKYDSNGGTGSMDDSVFKLATDVRLSSNKFSKENYTFIGWSTSKGGEVTYTNEAKVKDSWRRRRYSNFICSMESK